MPGALNTTVVYFVLGVFVLTLVRLKCLRSGYYVVIKPVWLAIANCMLPATSGLAGILFSVIWSVVGLIDSFWRYGVSFQTFLIFCRSFFAVLAALGFDESMKPIQFGI